MKLILESWRAYTDNIEESMADLKAIKAKYKDNPLLSKAVDALEDRDPSGNHKYIAWMMKQIKKSYDENHLGDPDLIDPEPAYRLLSRKVLSVGDAIYSFHDYSKKSGIWKGDDGKPLSKDINSWEDVESLASDIRDAYKRLDKQRQEKELKKRMSAQAKEESDVVYDDEQFMVIRPLSSHASCYYGMGTRWCISATDSRNYFDSYTKEGKVFYFVMDKTRSNDDPFKKVAWVGERSGFEDHYDAEDDNISYQTARGQMLETSTDEETYKIEKTMDQHLADNPPDLGWEEKIDEIVDDINERMDSTTLYAELGDEDSIYSHAVTRFLVNGNFDTEEFTRKEHAVAGAVMGVLRDSPNLYMDIDTEGDNVSYGWKNDERTMKIAVDISPEQGIYSIEEFEEFANNVRSELDNSNEEIAEEIRQKFIEDGITPPSFIDKVEEQIGEEEGVYLWDNVDVVYDARELDYDIDIADPKGASFSIHKARNRLMNREIVNSINSKAAQVQKQKLKQLELPGFEGAAEKKMYSLPDNVEVLVTSIKGGAKLTIRNTNTNQTDADAKATYEVMKLVDQMPEKFIKEIGPIIFGTKVDESKKKFTKLVLERKKR
tara:strand:+ start:892 stop:2703 length:1812 start_codon:yes stop_codon:yes gene_type:complete